MIKKIIFIKTIIFLFLLSLLKSQILSSENKAFIVLKIDNEIITNLDIKKEYKYLALLNSDLENLKKDESYFFARNSIMREKVKKIAIEKFLDINAPNEFVDNLIITFYKNLNLNSDEEISNFLKKNDLSEKDIMQKIKIEALWNELIYSKYRDQIVIDEDKLKIKIKNNKETTNLYLLYEILFKVEPGQTVNKKYEVIKKNIYENGIKNSAAEYSISDTSKFGGKIGWIKEEQLSEAIKEEVSKINPGEITNVIKVPGGYLILYVEDKKEEEKKLDLDSALFEIIKYEKNKQLNQFSLIYFNKIKNNLTFNEY